MPEMDNLPESDAGATGRGRRRFLEAVIAAFSALIGLVLGIPFLAALIGPIGRLKKLSYSPVAAVDTFPEGKPVDATFKMLSKDAFIQQEEVRHIWVIRHSSSKVTVFSPICPHLGCHYNWMPERHQFVCPCHGSVFTINGKVVGGPAPRPLDTLPWEIKEGRLFVEWERFKPGTPQKTRI
jgi:menaquinol-cytochrome c reductase iron-sulfur subunit